MLVTLYNLIGVEAVAPVAETPGYKDGLQHLVKADNRAQAATGLS